VANKKSDLLPRGFKARAERTAEDFRKELSLAVHAPLPSSVLATHLKVDLCPHPSFHSSKYPPFSDECSGATILDAYGKPFIVYNVLHSLARQESTLMHELAHIICKHFEENPYPGIAIPDNLRGHNPRHEAEAAYLGGCLQLPRVALVHIFKQRMTEDQIIEVYGASLEMVRYRMRITGVMKQMKKSEINNSSGFIGVPISQPIPFQQILQFYPLSSGRDFEHQAQSFAS